MTKAEQKRIESHRNRLEAAIKPLIAQTRNDVLEATGAWAVRKIENRLENIKKGILKPAEGWTKERAIKSLENRLKFRYTIAFNATKEAEISYDAKVQRMLDKMIAKGMRVTSKHGGRMEVEMISNYNYEMEFLIKGFDVEGETQYCHARVIYVDGIEVAPHYRFITTVRKKR